MYILYIIGSAVYLYNLSIYRNYWQSVINLEKQIKCEYFILLIEYAITDTVEQNVTFFLSNNIELKQINICGTFSIIKTWRMR